MIVDGSEVAARFAGKRLALIFFNKDCRTLLRAHAAGLRAFPFSVEYLIDPTLAYRPRVMELAASVVDPKRIVTDMSSLESLVRARAFDAALLFETGYENQPQAPLVPQSKVEVTTMAAFESKCRADYENYLPHDPNAEFNARWSKHCVEFLVTFLAQRKVQVSSAYNVVLPATLATDRYVVAFMQQDPILPNLPPSLERVPVRFVIGEDWACGKSTYVVDRMRGGAIGIMGDFWFRLVAPDAIPDFRMQDMFAVKGLVANVIRMAAERKPGAAVFVKYDGRIEEFVFGIPRDRTYLIKDMHHYFRDCRFVIVHKNDTPRMRDLVERFVKKFEITRDKVDRVKVCRDGRIDDLGPL